MLRKDREITDIKKIIEIIEKCDVCRIGLTDGKTPYVVPLNFGYEIIENPENSGNNLILYFHGANAGKKIDLINKNPSVCVEMDCSHNLIISDDSCGHTMEFESVIGFGTAEIITDISEKIHGLKVLMKKYVKDREFEFSEVQTNSVTVFKITVNSVSGKRLKR